MFILYRVAEESSGAPNENCGAQQAGRWNYADVSVWYASESIALAMLEVLQSNHREDSACDRHICRIEISDEVFSQRVKGTQEMLLEKESQGIGTDWAQRGKSLLLEVPSYVVPWEKNFIINPAHPHFAHIKVKSIGHILPDGRACKHSEVD